MSKEKYLQTERIRKEILKKVGETDDYTQAVEK